VGPGAGVSANVLGFHDGFSEYASDAGLSFVAQVLSLEDLYGGPIDRPDVAMRLDAARIHLWFSNGAGGYIAQDLDNCKHDEALVWWVRDPPIFNLGFWSLVDEWMVVLFDG